MRTFSVTYQNQPWRNRSFKVRGVCLFDALNPCWDNRPDDVAGQHWSGLGPACAGCTAAAKLACEKVS